MLRVSISPPVIRKTIAVFCSGAGFNRATLLGASGELLKVFQLTAEKNELVLDEFAPGNYSLKIETPHDTVVKQIIIP